VLARSATVAMRRTRMETHCIVRAFVPIRSSQQTARIFGFDRFPKSRFQYVYQRLTTAAALSPLSSSRVRCRIAEATTFHHPGNDSDTRSSIGRALRCKPGGSTGTARSHACHRPMIHGRATVGNGSGQSCEGHYLQGSRRRRENRGLSHEVLRTRSPLGCVNTSPGVRFFLNREPARDRFRAKSGCHPSPEDGTEKAGLSWMPLTPPR